MKTSRLLPVLLILVAGVLLPALAAAQHTFTEDFTTTTYKDLTHTTAEWDTTAGELKLPPLPALAGSYDTAGTAYDVVVAGDIALVADGGFVRVIDISNPVIPTLLGSVAVPAQNVAVSGNLAFAVKIASGLEIIDISDPANPTLIGSLTVSVDGMRNVVVDGDLAFVTDHIAGLVIIDISDPTTPALVANYDTPGTAIDVAVDGDLAFVTDASGLQVFDISDPTTPTVIGTAPTGGNPQNIAVDGDHVFVTNTTSGLQVVDVTDPTTPVVIGSLAMPGSPYGVAVDGDFVFVGDGSAGLHVIDVTDPTTPVLLGTYDTPSIALGVAVAGEHCFVADGASGIQVIRVGLPVYITSPLVGTYDTGAAFDVAVAGDLAVVPDVLFGLHVVDISNPTSMTQTGSLSSYGSKVAVAGDMVYTLETATNGSLRIISITNPASPVLLGSYGFPGVSRDLVVAGDLAFVANDSVGLQIIDVANPASPSPVGAYDAPGLAYTVAVDGDLAFVAGAVSGLHIIDINNPASPTLVSTYNSGGVGYDVAVDGDLAFLANNSPGLHIIDISNPASPTQVSTYGGSSGLGVAVVGDLVFLAEGFIGLLVIDISNPASPIQAGGYDTPDQAWAVEVAGDLAYVADRGELVVIQVVQHEWDATRPIGYSLPVDGGSDTIVRARLSSTETSGVTWRLSATDGTVWQTVQSDNAWNLFSVPGDNLRWVSQHDWVPGANPTVSDLTIEWLNDFAIIVSISDIPNDQGKHVRLEWARSAHDFIGDAQQIVEYAVYRKIDPNLNYSVDLTSPNKREGLSPVARAHASMMQAAGWDFVTTVPVRVEDRYAVVVPTLADSTIVAGDYYSTFMVSALTAAPGVFFDSKPDSGYSVDNLSPGVPQAFTVAYNTGSGNTLAWDAAPEPDFQYYRVYRGSDPNFVPGAGNLVYATATPGWVDPDYDGGMVYYKVTATDVSGNESDPSSAGTMTAVPDAPAPETFALHQNYPNPFNPTTLIHYDVPRGGAEVTLRIYDVRGALVRTLVEGMQAEGRRHATWDGRDGAGRRVSTGTYFYRLTAPGFEQTRKMVLLK